MAPFALNLLITGLWVVVSGDPGALNAAVGFLVGLGLLWWLWPRDQDRRYFRKIPAGLGFAAFFLWELLLSSLRVAYDVVPPPPLRRPAIVCVPLDLRSDASIALLANLLTLTPGTVVLGVSPDRSTMLIHALFAPDDEAFRRSIKNGFERRVKELLA